MFICWSDKLEAFEGLKDRSMEVTDLLVSSWTFVRCSRWKEGSSRKKKSTARTIAIKPVGYDIELIKTKTGRRGRGIKDGIKMG